MWAKLLFSLRLRRRMIGIFLLGLGGLILLLCLPETVWFVLLGLALLALGACLICWC